jgi:hypothetical protein
MKFDATGEKEQNPNPELLVAPGGGFLSREALQKKLHASHEWVPTMKNYQLLPREQKPDLLFPPEMRFYWFADS